jgi:general stress protein YciG
MARSTKRNQEAPEVSVSEAGRRGGEATRRTHGHEFYEQIGHLGGQKGGQRVRELINRGKQAEHNRSSQK